MSLTKQQAVDILDYVKKQVADEKHMITSIDVESDNSYSIHIQLHRKSQDVPEQLKAVAEVYARQAFGVEGELPITIDKPGHQQNKSTGDISR